MIEKIYIIDDVISKQYQEHIKHIVLNNINWYFSQDITYGNNFKSIRKQRPAFGHLLMEDGVIQSNTQAFFHPLILESCSKINFTVNNILRGKCLLQLPLTDDLIKDGVDQLHIDLYRDHLVCLYYVMDADGDTLIYDKLRGPEDTETKEYFADGHNLLERVTPKQGRVVLFNGNLFHTAEQPRNGIRSVINYNLI